MLLGALIKSAEELNERLINPLEESPESLINPLEKRTIFTQEELIIPIEKWPKYAQEESLVNPLEKRPICEHKEERIEPFIEESFSPLEKEPMSNVGEVEGKRKINSGTVVAAAGEAFEAKVGLEALQRAGQNPNLKGIVHEVMAKDMYNMNPRRLADGTKAMLSKSSTAVRDDILIMKGSNVVGRYQLKDTVAGINKTIKQVSDHHYAGTNLMGTTETVKAYKAAASGKGITQSMKSTGISSLDTSRIASKTIGSTAGKISAASMGKLATSSGAAGAAISGGIEAINSGVQLVNGEIDGSEFAENVGREALGGGLSAAGGRVAGTAVSTGVVKLLARTALGSVAGPIGTAAGIGIAIVSSNAIKNKFNDICDNLSLYFW